MPGNQETSKSSLKIEQLPNGDFNVTMEMSKSLVQNLDNGGDESDEGEGGVGGGFYGNENE